MLGNPGVVRDATKTVILKNAPWAVTESEVSTFFARVGEVSDSMGRTPRLDKGLGERFSGYGLMLGLHRQLLIPATQKKYLSMCVIWYT